MLSKMILLESIKSKLIFGEKKLETLVVRLLLVKKKTRNQREITKSFRWVMNYFLKGVNFCWLVGWEKR